MLFDLMIIAIIAVIFIFSCCRLLTKLRYHEEFRRTPHVQPTIAVIGSGIYPSNCGPPPFPEYDLPPKYEEVIKNSKDFPAVHNSPPLEKVIIQH